MLTLPDTAGLSPNRVFDTAFSDYSSSQYASAIAGFQQVIKNFPTAERADDAQFFIGESLVNMNRLPEAIEAYNLVTFPLIKHTGNAGTGICPCSTMRGDQYCPLSAGG